MVHDLGLKPCVEQELREARVREEAEVGPVEELPAALNGLSGPFDLVVVDFLESPRVTRIDALRPAIEIEDRFGSLPRAAQNPHHTSCITHLTRDVMSGASKSDKAKLNPICTRKPRGMRMYMHPRGFCNALSK